MVSRLNLAKRIAALGTALALFMAGCSPSTAPGGTSTTPDTKTPAVDTPAPKADPIKIAALTSFSGPFTVWGNNVRDGMKLAAEELNGAGGVEGREVVILERDAKASPDEAVTLLRGLVERDGVVAAGGIISSGVGNAASREAEALQVPLFLTMSGDHNILTKDSRYTFRTALTAAPMAMDPVTALVKERGIKKIGVIVADYAWGHATKDVIERDIATLPGVEVQIEVAPVPEKDFTTYLRRLQQMDPELLILSGHPPGNAIAAKQALELGVGDFSVGSWAPPISWMEGVGEAAFGKVIEFSSVDFEAPEYLALAEKFYGKYGTFFDNSAFSGYVIVKMVADAVAKTDSLDRKVIAEAVRTGRYVQPGYAFPLSYTEWGELKESAPLLHTFEAGDPGKINPGANWYPKVILRSPKAEPYVPEK